MQFTLPFSTMLLLISFASVNAVLFTPALPNIAYYFSISEEATQQTMSWFLLGYAVGQLAYGPLANRLGRKPALYLGIGLQIISSLICVMAGFIHAYWLLVAARFITALGAGVGLKMTFTLINENYPPKRAAQYISYLMLAFAITPGLGVALGGFLNAHLGWMSCFYVGAIYGALLLILVAQLPETSKKTDSNALQLNHLIEGYSKQFKNPQLITGGLLMGASTCFIYIFAAFSPFIAINSFNLSTDLYGVYNCIPSIGLILGSVTSAKLAERYSFASHIRIGISIASLGCLGMFAATLLQTHVLVALFLPMALICFGLCFIMANASVIAMDRNEDKVHGAAVMSFINMGFATLVVSGLSYLRVEIALLSISYVMLCIFMGFLMKGMKNTA